MSSSSIRVMAHIEGKFRAWDVGNGIQFVLDPDEGTDRKWLVRPGSLKGISSLHAWLQAHLQGTAPPASTEDADEDQPDL